MLGLSQFDDLLRFGWLCTGLWIAASPERHHVSASLGYPRHVPSPAGCYRVTLRTTTQCPGYLETSILRTQENDWRAVATRKAPRILTPPPPHGGCRRTLRLG